jgi:hypothetical protein
MRHRLLLAAIVFAAASSTAFAGVVITSTQVNLASKEASPISGFIEADRLKIVTPGNTVIFRGDLKKTWVIGTAARTYVEITPEVVSAFAARIAAAQTPGSPEQAKLQERLAKLRPSSGNSPSNSFAVLAPVRLPHGRWPMPRPGRPRPYPRGGANCTASR